MSLVATYSILNDTRTFYNPSITVTQTPIISAGLQRRTQLRVLYTVRAWVFATTPLELDVAEQAYRATCTQVGGTFEWKQDGQRFALVDSTTDLAWGPKPVHFSFDRVVGGRAAQITWSLESMQGATTGRQNIASNITQDQAVDFVYTVSTTVDQNFMSTRTYAGHLRLNPTRLSGVNPNIVTSFRGADQYRNTITQNVCPVPAGWQRVTQNFQQSEDRLSLSFAIVDEQKYIVYPAGVTDGDVTLSASNRSPFGGPFTYVLSGYFRGTPYTPDAPRQAFIDLATSVTTQGSAEASMVLRSLSLDRSVYTPTLSFRMEWDAYMNEGATPGNTIRVKSSNFILYLTSQAGAWIDYYRSNPVSYQTNPLAYGTTSVNGSCNSGTIQSSLGLIAPQLTTPGSPPNHQSNGTTLNSIPGASASLWGYKQFHQHFAYSYDLGKVVIPSKTATQHPQVQTTHTPHVYLTITGEAFRDYSPPEVPLPPYQVANPSAPTTFSAHVLGSKIEPFMPFADGPTYGVAWTYQLLLQLTTPTTLPSGHEIPWTPFYSNAGKATSDIWNSDARHTTKNDKLQQRPIWD